MSADRKLIVFDWNGTLFDDTRTVHESTMHTLAHFGVPAFPFEMFQETFQAPIIRMYEHFGVDEARLAADNGVSRNKFHDHYEAAERDIPLRDGARDLLESLKRHEVEAIILSNHIVDRIVWQLDRLAITDMIAHVSAFPCRDTQWGEPKGLRLKRYIDEKNIAPENTVIIGDTPEEIHIAREYGLTGVAISGGFASLTRLEQAQADHLVHSLPEFHNVLRARGYVA